MARRERAEDLRMGQLNASSVAGRRIGVERERVPLVQLGRTLGEHPEPQLRPLQVDQHPDRPPGLLLERTDHRHPLAHGVVRRMAHVDAEDVGPRLKEGKDSLAVGGSGTKGRDDLHATAATELHEVLLGLDVSVGRTARPASRRRRTYGVDVLA